MCMTTLRSRRFIAMVAANLRAKSFSYLCSAPHQAGAHGREQCALQWRSGARPEPRRETCPDYSRPFSADIS